MRTRFHAYRRDLPHWRLEGARYFVTWRLDPSQHELNPQERSLVLRALRFFDGVRYALFACVVMNDHVHGIVCPEPERTLASILHSWKSYTAHILTKEFGRSSKVWQHESYDHIVRDDTEYQHFYQYIRGNPSKRWPEIKEYPWLWLDEGIPSHMTTSA